MAPLLPERGGLATRSVRCLKVAATAAAVERPDANAAEEVEDEEVVDKGAAAVRDAAVNFVPSVIRAVVVDERASTCDPASPWPNASGWWLG